MPKLKPFFKRQGNVYFLQKNPPEVSEPSPEVKAQIFQWEQTGAKTLTLDEKGRVHTANVDPIDLYVTADGPRAASWLVWHHRSRLHRSGYVDFNIPANRETPIWFRVAFLFLQRRSKTISVVMTPASKSADGKRHYRMTWVKWNTFSPKARALSLIAPSAND